MWSLEPKFSSLIVIQFSQKTSKKNMVRKTQLKSNQKNIIKMVGSKTTYPKWHFGQVGHGSRKTIWGVVLTKNLGQKGHDFL
jgi:hypothetical protein